MCKLKEVYNPVDQERQERINRRLLVNTFLNNSSSKKRLFGGDV